MAKKRKSTCMPSLFFVAATAITSLVILPFDTHIFPPPNKRIKDITRASFDSEGYRQVSFE